jgi:hypothetical protein
MVSAMTTTARDEPTPASSGADPAVPGDDEVVVPVVRRRTQERRLKETRRQRHRTTGWLLASSVLFLGLLAGLAFVGYRASLKITGGTSTVTDPAAPGYVAEVQPTPVDLVAISDDEGGLAGAVIVTAGADGKGGTVIPVPAELVLPSFQGSTDDSLSVAYQTGGIDGLRQRLGAALGFGFTSASEVPAATVDSLAALVGPITIDNVDNLSPAKNRLQEGFQDTEAADGTNEVRYPAGDLTLQPDEVVDFLAFEGEGEPVSNQALRHQAVWTALLAGLAGKDVTDAGAAGGGQASALVELLPDLLAGDVTHDQLPIVEQTVPGTLFRVSVPDQAELPAFTARTIPAPIAAYPGQRARVRILNGTTDANATALVAPKVVSAGGMITAVGNADSFDEQTSRVEYLAAEARPAAEAIATALGLTAVESDSTEGGVDVSVVVGRDRAQ